MINLTVNGNYYSFEPNPGEMLSESLRERLGLTGTKIGCNEDECGACTVIIDGKPILSCTFPASRADRKDVLTIEGLAHTWKPFNTEPAKEQLLHPIQEAFVKHGAVQCGFCIPGQIMMTYALLQKYPDPTDEQIRHELKDTLCRCAGYPMIIEAIKAAAVSMRTGKAVILPEELVKSSPYTIIGTMQVRPDAVAKVTGEAIFTDDLKFEGMLHARVLRSEVPHGIVKNINISQALNLEGVVSVLTAEDIPAENNHGLVYYDWPVLVGIGEKVRYVGDALVILAAEKREIATQALDLIKVDYDKLPTIADPIQAHQSEAQKIHSQGNLLKHIKVRKGNVTDGFEGSDVVIEHTFHTPITEHAFLEPECSIARPLNDGRMEIYVGSQIPYEDRTQIARVLGMPEDHIRIIGQLMGGGFGGKEDIAGQIHAALLARSTGHPVKLLFDRQESFFTHPKRHATQIQVKIGAKNDGKLTAVETLLYGDTGAYASLGDKVMTRATTHSAGPYEIPHAKADCYAMYTNNPPAGAFRGFGVTQSAFAIESAMDMLANHLKIDPVELRLKNALKLGSITNTGQVLNDSVGLVDCIEKVSEELSRQIDGNPFLSREVPGAPELRRSWGFAVGYKNTGLGGGAPDKAGAEIELFRDGSLEIRTSSAELGQGLVSVLQIIIAEEFGVPLECVRVVVMDTDLTPDGGPTTASRQTYVTGNAALYAARTLKQAISAVLAERYDFPPDQIRFIQGMAQLNGHSVTLAEVFRILNEEGKEARTMYEYWAPETKPLGQGGDMHFAFSFAAQAAEVEVNKLTGEVRVLKVITACDVGRAINPLGLRGQLEGGVMMGLGNALTEEFIVEEGKIFTDRLARYRIPSISQSPEIIPIIVEHPSKTGPFGAKGVGEISSIPTTPAITNAIFNAVGVRIDRLPVDQEEIARTLNKLT